jgi:hypothetical protein
VHARRADCQELEPKIAMNTIFCICHADEERERDEGQFSPVPELNKKMEINFLTAWIIIVIAIIFCDLLSWEIQTVAGTTPMN